MIRQMLRSAWLVVILLLATPGLPAAAQAPVDPVIQQVDAPTPGTVVRNGSPVEVGGWAIDPSGLGTGVDMVQVYLDGALDSGGTLIGIAAYGKLRADVADTQGDARFAPSGYEFVWTPVGLTPGPHTLSINAHSLGHGWYARAVPVVAVGTEGAVTSPTPMAVAIADFAFGPPVLTVRVGDTVSWTNRDRAGHTATSDANLWDTGLLQPGQAGSFTFQTPGTFTYHCAIHQNMRGSIVVTSGG